MTRNHIGTFDLYDRISERFVDAELYGDIAAGNANDFLDHWKPVFEKKKSELAAAERLTDEALVEFSLEDAHWLWPEKAAKVSSVSVLRSFALEAQGMTQGLMIAAPLGFAKEPSQHGKPITEVMLLATAPWNRQRLVATPTFRGVGRILLSAAISLSMEEEHEGRISLYALSGAEEWYRDACRMTDLGHDAVKKMRHFEMTEAQAKRFIS